MLIKFIVSIFLVFASSNGLTHRGGCRFEVDVNSEFFPLISNQNGILYPKLDKEDSKWYLEMRQGGRFRADCAGEDNKLRSFGRSDVDVECILNDVIRTSEGFGSFDQLLCNQALTETIIRNGTCYNGYTRAEIAFVGATTPYSLITVCHNEEQDDTLWTMSQIRGADLGDSESINRPSFRESIFYQDISADTCYTQVGQIETVTELLGSAEVTARYIQTGQNLFMARGHLMPNGDGIYAYEKKATFYFINAHPQWQTVNGGNWNQLEDKVRAYAGNRKTTLTVYTGTFGVTTLDDVNGNPVEIWLGRNMQGKLVKKLPCPHLTWKVVHDEERGTGVAVIQFNNPWSTVQPKDILCEDICDQLSWITWKVRDMRLGYTYCCDVASFHKALPYAPDLGNLPLLDY